MRQGLAGPSHPWSIARCEGPFPQGRLRAAWHCGKSAAIEGNFLMAKSLFLWFLGAGWAHKIGL